MHAEQIKAVCQVRSGHQVSVAVVLNGELHVLNSGTLQDCASTACKRGLSLPAYLATLSVFEVTPYSSLDATYQVVSPISTKIPTMTFIGGTGLTHQGKDRDQMHGGTETVVTDSKRMQIEGAQSGKLCPPSSCWEPELFLKGDGRSLVLPGGELIVPSWGVDGGEEAELVGVFVIAENGAVMRVGYCIGNEFSDHGAEKRNYLHLAGSKLRTCSIGPVIMLEQAPSRIEGTINLYHAGAANAYWTSPFVTGEEVMNYSLSNLDWHHFKHAHHRLPNSVHLVFYGTATLSYTAGIKIDSGDRIRIYAPDFIFPLENTVRYLTPTEDRFVIGSLFDEASP